MLLHGRNLASLYAVMLLLQLSVLHLFHCRVLCEYFSVLKPSGMIREDCGNPMRCMLQTEHKKCCKCFILHRIISQFPTHTLFESIIITAVSSTIIIIMLFKVIYISILLAAMLGILAQ
jgi:hypothetical protein